MRLGVSDEQDGEDEVIIGESSESGEGDSDIESQSVSESESIDSHNESLYRE